MKSLAAALSTAVLTFVGFASAGPTRADERFCNQTTYPAEVIEAHKTPGKGLAVKGTVRVAPGTCASIVPGRLTQRRYYLRVTVNGEAYGQPENHLCFYSLRHFTIEAEDAPGFKCTGNALPSTMHISGFTNAPARLGEFFAFDTNGEASLIVTQRSNLSFHFALQ